MTRPKLYLLDVEGTVAPVSLVTEQLFPYARKHCAEFLERHCGEPAPLADLKLLAEENRTEDEPGCPVFRESLADAIAYIHWLMDRDRKSTALKSLQGKIWRAGYERGEL